MGQRGPKSKPASVHYLNGNPSKKPAAVLSAGLHPAIEVPACPVDLLSDDARGEWERVTIELAKLRVIAQVDMAAVAVYCQAWGDWCEARRKLKVSGFTGYITVTPSGYEQQSVLFQIANKAAETMKSYGALFGMNPSARTGVQPSQGDMQLGLFESDENGSGAEEEAGPEKYF